MVGKCAWDSGFISLKLDLLHQLSIPISPSERPCLRGSLLPEATMTHTYSWHSRNKEVFSIYLDVHVGQDGKSQSALLWAWRERGWCHKDQKRGPDSPEIILLKCRVWGKFPALVPGKSPNFQLWVLVCEGSKCSCTDRIQVYGKQRHCS